MSAILDSTMFAHIASEDLAKLAAVFARAYVRFSSRENFQNELDDVGEVAHSCVGMKSEANGTHACATHASPTAREMTADERVDYAAESGERVRCAKCDVDEPQPRRRQEAKR